MVNNTIHKHVLSNGLTILVLENYNAPSIAVQLWYKVGSRYDPQGKKGLAHMIEHMVYKGTTHFAEEDLSFIIFKLIGYSNAYTSHDYTWYSFSLPERSLSSLFFVLNNIMYDVLFKEDRLNSELQSVIQELKRDEDTFIKSLTNNMLATLFPYGPYHYPIIGLINDIVTFNYQDLANFYTHYYTPCNTTIVVIGPCKLKSVIALAKEYGNSEKYSKKNPIKNSCNFLLTESINLCQKLCQKIEPTQTLLYKNTVFTLLQIGFKIPGVCSKKLYTINFLALLLVDKDNSRLAEKLLHRYKLVQNIYTNYYERFDESVFFIICEVIDEKNVDRVTALIYEEIEIIINKGIAHQEIKAITEIIRYNYYVTYSDNDKLAQSIGVGFLATGNKNYFKDLFLEYNNYKSEEINQEIRDFLAGYFKPYQAHSGIVRSFNNPLNNTIKQAWYLTQNCDNAFLNKWLENKQRITCIDKPDFVYSIPVPHPTAMPDFKVPQPNLITLDNGLYVAWYNNSQVPTIEIVVDTLLYSDYDPDNRGGLTTALNRMFMQSDVLKNFDQEGILFSSNNGTITLSLLSHKLPIALKLLYKILVKIDLNAQGLEAIKHDILNDIKSFWLDPPSIANHLACKAVYKSGPLSRISLGEQESIKALTVHESLDYYYKLVNPRELSISIVGDIKSYDIEKLVKDIFGAWNSNVMLSNTKHRNAEHRNAEHRNAEHDNIKHVSSEDLNTKRPLSVNYPKVYKPLKSTLTYCLDRSQTLLCYAGLSVNTQSKNYLPLYLFDQLFIGGVLANMSSQIFKIRNQYGLFYEIEGSLVKNAGSQPGLAYIQVLVSPYNVAEAHAKLAETISYAGTGLTLNSSLIYQAANALFVNFINKFENNLELAYLLVSQDDKLNQEYYQRYKDKLYSVTQNDIHKAMHDILDLNHLITIIVGPDL